MDKHHHHEVPGVVTPQTPDVPDVLQEPEPLVLPVPVKHDGPILSQELPALLGTATQYVAGTQPQVVLNASRFRKRATLISTDNPFLIVYQRNNVVPAACATWPANVPFIYTAQSELSVATASGTAAVSVVTEDWAR